MKKEKKYFYCTGCYKRHHIIDSAQELNGKHLCKDCYNDGFLLKVVTKVEVLLK